VEVESRRPRSSTPPRHRRPLHHHPSPLLRHTSLVRAAVPAPTVAGVFPLHHAIPLLVTVRPVSSATVDLNTLSILSNSILSSILTPVRRRIRIHDVAISISSTHSRMNLAIVPGNRRLPLRCRPPPRSRTHSLHTAPTAQPRAVDLAATMAVLLRPSRTVTLVHTISLLRSAPRLRHTLTRTLTRTHNTVNSHRVVGVLLIRIFPLQQVTRPHLRLPSPPPRIHTLHHTRMHPAAVIGARTLLILCHRLSLWHRRPIVGSHPHENASSSSQSTRLSELVNEQRSASVR